MNGIISAIGKRLPKEIIFPVDAVPLALLGILLFIAGLAAWFQLVPQKYEVPSGYVCIQEDGTLTIPHEALTKKQLAHSKLVPLKSEGLIETAADVHNGYKTNLSYSVSVTLSLGNETRQTLAQLYSKLPSTDPKVAAAQEQTDSEIRIPDTPQPILDLIEAELHPVAERLVLDLKNSSTTGANSDLNVRFRQVFETHDMVLPKWIKHLEVDGVHVTGWEYEN